MRDSRLRPRFPSRFVSVAFIGLLAIAMAATPHRMAAEQAASMPDSQLAAQPSIPNTKPESGQSEEEKRNDTFRLEGPLVKWTARAIGAPVPVVARSFEVMNFLIIVLAIGVPLFRFLPKFLVSRAAKVRSDIESARKVTEDANARLSAVEAKLSRLGEEIQKFRGEVEAESAQDEARIKASLAEESKRIVEAVEQEIGQAAAQARRGLRNFAAGLAVEQAAKKLVLTPEIDRALIAEFIGDVARNGSEGGKN